MERLIDANGEAFLRRESTTAGLHGSDRLLENMSVSYQVFEKRAVEGAGRWARQDLFKPTFLLSAVFLKDAAHPEVSLSDIYKSAFPFLALQMLSPALMIASLFFLPGC